MPPARPETENRKRILVIDDDAFRLRAIALALSQQGYQVDLAQSAERGLALIARQRPDMILLDVVLPGLSGLELCRRLKADPGLRDIPLVLVSSALLSSRAQAEGLEAGAEGYLAWPITSRELVARVALALRLAPARSAPAGVPQEDPLTAQQREVVQLIVQGHTTREVAAMLGISLRTAETHRAAAMRALDLHSPAQLIRHVLGKP